MARKVNLVIPTPINVLTAVHAQILASQKAGVTSTVVLPTLRTRAYMMVNNTGVLPIVTDDSADPTGFTR